MVLCGWLGGQIFIPSLAPIMVISSILSILRSTEYSDGIDARKVPNVTENQSCPCKTFSFWFWSSETHLFTHWLWDFKWRTGRQLARTTLCRLSLVVKSASHHRELFIIWSISPHFQGLIFLFTNSTILVAFFLEREFPYEKWESALFISPPPPRMIKMRVALIWYFNLIVRLWNHGSFIALGRAAPAYSVHGWIIYA